LVSNFRFKVNHVLSARKRKIKKRVIKRGKKSDRKNEDVEENHLSSCTNISSPTKTLERERCLKSEQNACSIVPCSRNFQDAPSPPQSLPRTSTEAIENTSKNSESSDVSLCVLLLLLDLSRKKFELIDINLPSQKTDVTVKFILDRIPFHATTSLGKQKYRGIVHLKDGVENINLEAKMMAKIGETLVPIPELNNGDECIVASRYIMTFPELNQLIERPDIQKEKKPQKRLKLPTSKNKIDQYSFKRKPFPVKEIITYKYKSFPLSAVIKVAKLGWDKLLSSIDTHLSDYALSSDADDSSVYESLLNEDNFDWEDII